MIFIRTSTFTSVSPTYHYISQQKTFRDSNESQHSHLQHHHSATLLCYPHELVFNCVFLQCHEMRIIIVILFAIAKMCLPDSSQRLLSIPLLLCPKKTSPYIASPSFRGPSRQPVAYSHPLFIDFGSGSTSRRISLGTDDAPLGSKVD